MYVRVVFFIILFCMISNYYYIKKYGSIIVKTLF